MRMAFLAVGLVVATGAHAQQYGAWAIDRLAGQQAYYAATSNDAGGILGKLCTATGCQWVITVSNRCVNGTTYPALLSSASGAAAITLQCAPNDKYAGRYIIRDFNLMEAAVTGSTQIGFAMPLDTGEFHVARWPTSGWAMAAPALAGRVSVLLRHADEKNL